MLNLYTMCIVIPLNRGSSPPCTRGTRGPSLHLKQMSRSSIKSYWVIDRIILYHLEQNESVTWEQKSVSFNPVLRWKRFSNNSHTWGSGIGCYPSILFSMSSRLPFTKQNTFSRIPILDATLSASTMYENVLGLDVQINFHLKNYKPSPPPAHILTPPEDCSCE